MASVIVWVHHPFVFLHSAAFLMLIGLASFSSVFHCGGDDSCSVKPGWSYDVGWVAMVISVLCSLYFASVGIYRFRHPNDPVTHPGVSKVYAPLAQFASTESASDDDDDENLWNGQLNGTLCNFNVLYLFTTSTHMFNPLHSNYGEMCIFMLSLEKIASWQWKCFNGWPCLRERHNLLSLLSSTCTLYPASLCWNERHDHCIYVCM